MPLLDLPDEVLELIFQQIPYWKLDAMKNIPELEPYALSQMYTSVAISPSPAAMASRTIYLVERIESYDSYVLSLPKDAHIPEFHGHRDFANFIAKTPLAKPKQIRFNGIGEFLNLHESFPELLKDCKIQVWVRDNELKSADFEKLQTKRYPMDEFIFCKYSFDIAHMYDKLFVSSGIPIHSDMNPGGTRSVMMHTPEALSEYEIVLIKSSFYEGNGEAEDKWDGCIYMRYDTGSIVAWAGTREDLTDFICFQGFRASALWATDYFDESHELEWMLEREE
ncbi:hypothetical protein Cantr_00658 [Candida viswanathii]|uniref:Uncharacterized protein n=1 Tax=Candida viswanathii TaxID=5486 RepID=A0A367YG56_9ASCO|nr:hypothetical protein Cantr_00658 [Candida viswanathii]